MIQELFPNEKIGSYLAGSFAQKGDIEKQHNSLVTGKELKTLLFVSDKQIDEALQAAKLGHEKMRSKTAFERANILEEIATLLEQYRDSLANLITHEMGKPIKQAKGEVDYTIGYFRFFAQEATRIFGLEIPSSNPCKKLRTRFEPIGPCAVITPWNFPLAMAGRKIASAIAAGCAVIAKPSSTSPLSLLALGTLSAHSSLPKEALSILIGDTEKISHALTSSSIIRKLSFTGSCEAGESLYRACAKTMKKLTLELGGHAPFLVFADCDIKKAAIEAVQAKFRNGGQTCICANRFLIERKVYESFAEQFTKQTKKLHVGDPLDERTDLSFHLHPTSVKKVPLHIENALGHGAKSLMRSGHPYEPEILLDAKPEMQIFQEETFGPVAPLMPFDREEEAIHLANDTPYGLAAYLFTNNLQRAERISAALNFGIIGLNDGAPSTPNAPFGGVKASGFGREGGPSGIYEYLMEKTISYGNLD
ncbi:MAG: NAD-dependent succinate-semialdehyde dehydrogenase [Candidatus Algichlamydia australiensis]|nr:NAD-dependent succinate-semialdehyde dehydrogenase [Chlamydiales bacterium]